MDKETYKKLTKDFPKSVVKKAPPGKFGDYVPHHIYTQRLVDVIPGKYNFKYEPLRDKDGALAGAKCILEIDGLGTIEEVGDVDSNQLKNNNTESELLKLAVSDGIKRCCMRFGIGLELWTGGITEEEHYAVQQPIQKTGTIKDVVIEKEEQEALNKAKQDFAKEIGAEEDSVSDQLNDILEGMCPDKAIRNELKKTSYDKCVEEGMSKEVDDWSDDDMKTFLTYFGDSLNNNAELLSAVTTDISDTKMQCPDCNKFDTVVDNREKKNSDPKFAKIPDFACDNYGADKDGCGKGWWIGGDDFPFEKWL
jgi:hypothetical protein